MPNVPARASGTVTLAMNVGQNRRRKRKITMTTSAMLSKQGKLTSCTEARIVVVRSLSTSSRSRVASTCQLGQLRLDAVDRLDHVRPGLLEDDQEHGRLSVPAARRLFSTPSTTLPRTLSRTGVPLLSVSGPGSDSRRRRELVVAGERIGEPVPSMLPLGRFDVGLRRETRARPPG